MQSRLLLLAAAAVLAACGGGPSDDGPQVSTVEVTSSAASVPIGGSVTLAATARDEAGRTVAGRTATWNLSGSGTVDITGTTPLTLTVRGGVEGTVTARATIDGKFGETTITVTPAPVARVEVTGPATLAVGSAAQFAARTYDASNNELFGRAVTWSSSNEAIASVSGTGMVTGVAEGSAAIRATAGGITASAPVSVELAALGPFARDVVAGMWHSCALTAEGIASCWGMNLSGQLGDGTTTSRALATPVAGTHVFASLSAGAEHTCGVTITGAVLCWGNNDQAQLGDGTTTRRTQPTPVVGLPSNVQISAVVAGVSLTCALANTGAAWCWGYNGGGQAGIGAYSTELLRTPTAVTGGHAFSSLVLGETHACGLAGESVLCWGDNLQGQVGDDTSIPRLAPTPVGGNLGPVAQIVAGGMHTCALGADRVARCWGHNDVNQLATLPPNPLRRGLPAPIEPASLRFVRMGGGPKAYHTCGVIAGGELACWGSNGFGQRGTGGVDSPFGATPVVRDGLAFVEVAAGNFHTCGFTIERRVYCWGNNERGQLGDGTTTRRLTPVLVKRAP